MADRHRPAAAFIDLDLIAASYRSLTDPAAFDEMIDVWNRKLAILEREPDWSERGLGPEVLAHLMWLERIAEGAAPPADDPIRRAIESRDGAAMIQSPEGRVVAMNDAAAAAFGCTTGAIDPLDWLDPVSRSELGTIRRSAAERGNRQRAILRSVARPDAGSGCGEIQLVEAQVLRVPSADTGFVLIHALALPWSAAAGEAMAETFSLTTGEIDVLRLFYAARDLREVAERRGVSIKTVRTQFKSILAKTASRSQPNLLHLVSVLCARAVADAGGREMDWAAPFGNERILLRGDGRRLAYSMAGAADGRPLLWLHGPGFNGIPPKDLIASLARAGWRLILPSRPGHGNSDGGTSASVEEDQVSAIVDLAAMLGLEHCPAVGTTCSAQALLLARDRVPERIGAIVAMGHCWKLDAAQVARLPVGHRTLLKLAHRAPSILRAVCSVGLRIVRHSGADWYVQRAHGYSSANRACLRDAETQALLRSDCRMLLAQGIDGFIADLLLSEADVADATQRATSPTLWLMGAQDQQHDPGREAPCSKVELRVLEECSELMLYQRPDLIAAAILEVAAGPPGQTDERPRDTPIGV